jgi:hypothetical protein
MKPEFYKHLEENEKDLKVAFTIKNFGDINIKSQTEIFIDISNFLFNLSNELKEIKHV